MNEDCRYQTHQADDEDLAVAYDPTTPPPFDELSLDDIDDGPSDDDIVSDGGPLGGRYYVSQLDRTFADSDTMDKAIREWMEREQFWPTVWIVSDHGDASPYPLG